MARERLSVDELLARQDEPGELRATIEAVPGDDEQVKVTPYVSDAGCLCSLAIAVRKDQIDSLATTDESHRCCGKTLAVVTVTFADATLTNVFGQLSNSARRARGGVAEPGAVRDEPSPLLRRQFTGALYDPYFDYAYLDASRMAYGDYLRRRHALSYEELYSGHLRGALPSYPSYPNPDQMLNCMRDRNSCYTDCEFSTDPVRCRCNCIEGYAHCMDPTYRIRPC